MGFRSLGVMLVLLLAAGCGTQRYSNFYRRYADTCERTPAQPQRPARYIPNLAPIKAEFIQTLGAHAAEIRQCYSDALRYGETDGTIQLALALEPDGEADPVTVSADSTTFAPLSCCVVAVVKSLKFPRTGERESVGFDYSFSFRIRSARARAQALKDGFVVELAEPK